MGWLLWLGSGFVLSVIVLFINLFIVQSDQEFIKIKNVTSEMWFVLFVITLFGFISWLAAVSFVFIVLFLCFAELLFNKVLKNIVFKNPFYKK